MKPLALLSASLLVCATASAADVYSNTDNLLNRSFAPANNAEFGDQVFLSGTDRRVTDFAFDYFVQGGGNETAQIFFYKNDGGPNGTAPGTLIYQSGTFNLSQGANEQTINAISISTIDGTVPNTFTWTVKFGGVDLGEQVGLLLANPPTLGTSVDDFWVRNSDGSWATFLIDSGTVPANFAARITAVPEPGTMALMVLGGLAIAGVRRFQRRSA